MMMSLAARTRDQTDLPELPTLRLGMVAERAQQWSCEMDVAEEEEEMREQMDPVG